MCLCHLILSLIVFSLWNLSQGHVTSVPKHSLDIVPIQLTCHRKADGESKYADETFVCLWKNVQHVVEFASRNPHSSVKYQLNFCVMLQEVLRSNIHLLTEDEKTYMGITTCDFYFQFLVKYFKQCLIYI